jgi:putative transposase
VSSEPLIIEHARPWEDAQSESFNGKFRDELLSGEGFCTVKEAQIWIERWRKKHKYIKPHGSLACRSFALLAWLLSSIRQVQWTSPQV